MVFKIDLTFVYDIREIQKKREKKPHNNIP
jgi:hypothetical protein